MRNNLHPIPQMSHSPKYLVYPIGFEHVKEKLLKYSPTGRTVTQDVLLHPWFH